MSMDQPIDPSLIEQTKMQIRTLVKEIAQLSRSEMTPDEYFAEFLPRVVSALAAIGGAIWTVDEQGRMGLQYQINLQETGLRESEEAQMRHGRLLHKTLQSGESSLVPPQSGSEGEDEAGNPTNFLLVLGPIRTELSTVAIVEVFQRPGAGPKTQSGYLNFLNQVTELATGFFKNRQLRHFGDRESLWTQLEEFTRNIHSSLDPKAAAYTIANEGRRLIECDRVSVALQRGRKCVVEAVSGQDLFDKRSNLVRLMGDLATSVVASEEPLWYTGSTDTLAPQVEDAIQEYVDESHSKAVAVLPIFPPLKPENETDDIDDREPLGGPIGALIVEQIEDSRVPEKMRKRIEVVGEHSRLALHNAQEHNSLFLMPLWRTIGKSKVLLKAKHLPKTITVSAAILVVLIGMFIVPWDFEMVSDGTLQPVDHRDVFAQVDRAEVVEVTTRHGAKVQPGDQLCELYSSELAEAIEVLNGEIATANKNLAAISRKMSLGASGQDLMTLQGQRAQVIEELRTLEARRLLYQEKHEDLFVRAPIAGEVVTWDVEDRLKERPVQRGQVLMRIADPAGPWEVQLQMPDKRMGSIREAIEKQKTDELRVEFILATDPDKKFYGTIEDIHELAEVRGEEGNTVTIKVKIDEKQREELDKQLGPEALRPGAAVSAKVYCGKAPVGYVLLHDAFAYVRKNIWFRIW